MIFFFLNYNTVDGIWGNWLNWDSCSVTCDFGTRSRSRLCNNPSPSNGGMQCQGSSVETEWCKLRDCLSFGKVTKSYRLFFYTNCKNNILILYTPINDGTWYGITNGWWRVCPEHNFLMLSQKFGSLWGIIEWCRECKSWSSKAEEFITWVLEEPDNFRNRAR